MKKSAKTDDVIPRIRRLIADQLKINPKKIALKAHLQNDLQGDSLDALEIIFQLEEEFKIKVDEKDARAMVTVQDIVDYVAGKVKR